MDYIKHWKRYSSLYAFSILYFFFLFSPIYVELTTQINMLLVVSTVLFCLFFYSMNKASALHREPMSRYDYKYLTTKFFDVFLQQMIIYVLFYITNQSLLLFSTIFVLVHIHLFFYKRFLSVIIFMLIAVLLSIIFYTAYSTFGSNGFGIAYLIHMSIYLIGSMVFKYVYRHAI